MADKQTKPEGRRQRRWFAGAGVWAENVEIAAPGQISEIAQRAATFLAPFVRLLFRPRIEGLERLPDNRPFLLVANHSAGAGIAEILSFLVLYVQRFGRQRPLAGFALPLGFHVFPLNWLLRQVGAIPSSEKAAMQTLAAGVPILVFPGGDHETLRPVWQAHRVDFGGRSGYMRLAQRARVDVVPLAIRGAHFTAPVFYRANWLAWLFLFPRLLGIKRWGVSLLSLLGAFAIALLSPLSPPLTALLVWLWMGSPLIFLPLVPWTIRMKVGEPLSASALCEGDVSLAEASERLQRHMEQLMREA